MTEYLKNWLILIGSILAQLNTKIADCDTCSQNGQYLNAKNQTVVKFCSKVSPPETIEKKYGYELG